MSSRRKWNKEEKEGRGGRGEAKGEGGGEEDGEEVDGEV